MTLSQARKGRKDALLPEAPPVGYAGLPFAVEASEGRLGELPLELRARLCDLLMTALGAPQAWPQNPDSLDARPGLFLAWTVSSTTKGHLRTAATSPPWPSPTRNWGLKPVTSAHEVRRSTLKRFTRLVPASLFAPPSKCEARPPSPRTGPSNPASRPRGLEGYAGTRSESQLEPRLALTSAGRQRLP